MSRCICTTDSTVQSEMSIALASVSPKASEPVTSEKVDIH